MNGCGVEKIMKFFHPFCQAKYLNNSWLSEPMKFLVYTPFFVMNSWRCAWRRSEKNKQLWNFSECLEENVINCSRNVTLFFLMYSNVMPLIWLIEERVAKKAFWKWYFFSFPYFKCYQLISTLLRCRQSSFVSKETETF